MPESERNKTCPYCQSPIKSGSERIVCSACLTPHHKECWDENGGCTTFGCNNNPVNRSDSDEDAIIIETAEAVSESTVSNLINCRHCRGLIDENSVYCKFCGERTIPLGEHNPFEEEFRKRYREKATFNRRRNLLTLTSFLILFLLLLFLVIVLSGKSQKNLPVGDNRFSEFLIGWKESWESKNIDAYEKFLTNDYRYSGPDNVRYNKRQRMRRIKWTFENYKFINISLTNVRSKLDGDTAIVKFRQDYRSDKYEESGLKTLHLRKEQEQWKIFRESFK